MVSLSLRSRRSSFLFAFLASSNPASTPKPARRSARHRQGAAPLHFEGLEERQLLSTYYVATNGNDSGAGSSSSPWQSLQKAVDSVSAGDTIIVKAGTYNVGANMFGLTGGTPSNPITIEADPSASPGSVIVTHCANDGTNANAAAFNIESTGTWIVKGFTINSDGSMQKAGIRIANSNNSEVIDNTVNEAFTGIFVSNANNSLIQNNLCENSTDQHGIYISLDTDDTIIQGNTLTGNNWDGLHMNCLVGSPNQNAVVEDNVIYGNDEAGMDIEGIDNAVIENNLIYNNTKEGITIHSQDQTDTPDTMNNTIVNNTIVGNGMSAIQVLAPDTQGETIFNNILMNSNSEYGAIAVSGTPSGLVSDYNVVCDDFSTDLAVDTLTLAQWQSSTGQDKHDIVSSATALFTNTNNNVFTLLSSAQAINAGVSSLNGQSAPTVDFAGNSRPQGSAIDVGAYESAGSKDTTPPTLSAIASTGLTSSGATITWTTNESATTQVEYGTSSSYGHTSTLNSTLATGHSVALTGLAASTTYHFAVISTDAAGNQAVSSDFTFTTAAAGDTTAPTAAVASSGPVVPGSQNYTFTVAYSDNTAVNASSINNASVQVTGPNGFNQTAVLVSVNSSSNGTPRIATYQITEPSGIWSTSDNGTYTVSISANGVEDTAGNFLPAGTLGTFAFDITDTTPLTASNVNAAASTTQATITWTTNKPGTSEVDYGTSASYGLASAYNASLVTSHSVTLTGLTAGTTYHFRVKSWDASNNHLVSSDFTFTAGSNSDTVAPTASLNPGISIASGSTTYDFTVTYADNTAVNASSIGSSNILVTGPNGFSQVATLVSASSSANGSPITAVYQITAPYGLWTSGANGQYTIAMQANQVTDTSGNPVASGTLGTFSVNLAAPTIPGDVNGDGTVNNTDLVVILTHYGMTGTGIPGDTNGDGVVNNTDLVALLTHFGE